MPTLPTLTVTQAQADRMLAAYGSAANYKEWLRKRIIDEVTRVELAALEQQNQAAKQAKAADIAAALPASS